MQEELKKYIRGMIEGYTLPKLTDEEIEELSLYAKNHMFQYIYELANELWEI